MLKTIFSPSFSSQSFPAFFLFFVWQNIKKIFITSEIEFFVLLLPIAVGPLKFYQTSR